MIKKDMYLNLDMNSLFNCHNFPVKANFGESIDVIKRQKAYNFKGISNPLICIIKGVQFLDNSEWSNNDKNGHNNIFKAKLFNYLQNKEYFEEENGPDKEQVILNIIKKFKEMFFSVCFCEEFICFDPQTIINEYFSKSFNLNAVYKCKLITTRFNQHDRNFSGLYRISKSDKHYEPGICLIQKSNNKSELYFLPTSFLKLMDYKKITNLSFNAIPNDKNLKYFKETRNKEFIIPNKLSKYDTNLMKVTDDNSIENIIKYFTPRDVTEFF